MHVAQSSRQVAVALLVFVGLRNIADSSMLLRSCLHPFSRGNRSVDEATGSVQVRWPDALFHVRVCRRKGELEEDRKGFSAGHVVPPLFLIGGGGRGGGGGVGRGEGGGGGG